MLGRGNGAERDLIRCAAVRRIEHAELHARCIQPLGRADDHIFAEETLPHGIRQCVETRLPDAAGQIRAGLQRNRCSVHNV